MEVDNFDAYRIRPKDGRYAGLCLSGLLYADSSDGTVEIMCGGYITWPFHDGTGPQGHWQIIETHMNFDVLDFDGNVIASTP